MALSTNGAEIKAEEYMALAEKALKKFSIFSSAGKFEEAGECYEKAGNQYKIAKKWQLAGTAYAKCAEMQIKLKETSRASQFYQSAAEAIQKVNPGEAVAFYRKAISMLCDAGRFSSAAKLQKGIAEIYEQADKLDAAIENYQQAADYFNGENQVSSANSMLLKVAEFSGTLERYEAAIEIYENVASACMESNLLKFNAKGHLLNAGICALASKDVVLAQQKLQRFGEIDYTFADSREGKLFADLVQALEDLNADAFADAIYQYDNISKLDTWKISMLLRAKDSISGSMNEAVSLT